MLAYSSPNLRRKGRSDARIPIERDIDAELDNQRLDGRREKVAGPRIDRLIYDWATMRNGNETCATTKSLGRESDETETSVGQMMAIFKLK